MTGTGTSTAVGRGWGWGMRKEVGVGGGGREGAVERAHSKHDYLPAVALSGDPVAWP